MKNVFFATGANLSRIVTTLILTLVLPRVLSVEDYSYWQLYLFYGTYMIYSSIGWCEGTYLKYGGMEYSQVDGRECASQFWSLCIYETLVAVGLCLWGAAGSPDGQRLFLFAAAAVYMLLYIPKVQIQTILQATNRISDYAWVYAGERLIYFVLVIAGLLLQWKSFYLVIFAELISNLLMLGYGTWLCRDVIFRRPLPLPVSLRETAALIRVGYKLTLAGLASQLVIGIVRISIEYRWGTVVFGKISLSFSMANMLITCITAVSIVLFPMLKRSSREVLREHYSTIRWGLTIPMFGMLLAYAPMKSILSWWLPQYAQSLKYLAILFPLCIFETRNTLLVWTYLKVLRKEAQIMRVSLIMIVLSALLTYFTVSVWDNLDLTVGLIMVLYALKAALTEYVLSREMYVCRWTDWLAEGCLSGVFILCSWSMGAVGAFFAYLAAYSGYLLFMRKDLMRTAAKLRQLWHMGRE